MAQPTTPRRRAGRGGLITGVTLIVAAAVLVGIDVARTSGTDEPPRNATGPTSAPPHQAAPPAPTPAASAPHDGTGQFTYAVGTGPLLSAASGPAPVGQPGGLGSSAGGPGVDAGGADGAATTGATQSGGVKRFHVAVEDGLGLDVTPFAGAVDGILGDQRSWIADGRLRLQRVAPDSDADFTIYLASAGTSTRMCAVGGLDTEGYTSCRLPGQVIINADRWVGAIPGYDAPLATYQAYAVNHEVGHELGYQHEACPLPGAPAPVMQQQTLGMQGCLPNGWPWVGGARYTGPPIP